MGPQFQWSKRCSSRGRERRNCDRGGTKSHSSVEIRRFGVGGGSTGLLGAVPAGALNGVVAISGGWIHSVALKSDGTVITWGSKGYGDPLTVPAEASSRVIAIAAGGYFTAALVLPPVVEKPVPLLVSRVQQGGSPVEELVISWAAETGSYILQSATDLSPPLSWQTVIESPVITGEQHLVTTTSSGGSRIFRLSK